MNSKKVYTKYKVSILWRKTEMKFNKSKTICFAVTSYGTLSTHDKKLDQ